MKNNVILFTIVAILLVSCNKNKEKENLNHHGEDKVQFTCYTNDFELFAEADIFMVGEKANILSHFSKLPSFKALEDFLASCCSVVSLFCANCWVSVASLSSSAEVLACCCASAASLTCWLNAAVTTPVMFGVAAGAGCFCSC